MRIVKPRNPEYTKGGKPIYNPGLVDCYQKPWYIRGGNYGVEYYGRFCEEGNPGNVRLEFNPLRELINKIDKIKPSLKDEITTMIEEMEDAHREEKYAHIRGLPSDD